MMVDSSLPFPRLRTTSLGMAISGVTKRLLNAFHCLFDLLDTPRNIPGLSPLIQREILYLLLIGDQGNRLRQMTAARSQSNQVGKAVLWLKENSGLLTWRKIHDTSRLEFSSQSFLLASS